MKRRNPDDIQLRRLENQAITEPSETNLIRYIQTARRSNQVNNDLVVHLFTKHLEEEVIPEHRLASEIIIDLVFPYVQTYTHEQQEQIRNQISDIRNTTEHNSYELEPYAHITLPFFESRTIMSDIIFRVINLYLGENNKNYQRDLNENEDKLLKKHFVMISNWVKDYYINLMDFDWEDSLVDESIIMGYVNRNGFDEEILGPYEGYGAGRINDFSDLPNTENYSDVKEDYFDFSTILNISVLANHSVIHEWTDNGSHNSYFDINQREQVQIQWEEEENWRTVQHCQACGEESEDLDDDNVCPDCGEEDEY
jgi:hypothetical protein